MKMKKNRILYIIIILSVPVFFYGCNDNYLDRPPEGLVDAQHFFDTPKQLKIATNDFYRFFDPEGVVTDDAASDNIVPLEVAARVRGSRIVPTKRGSGGWSWSALRDINYFMANYHQCPDPDARARYSAVARFFRAFFYFNKVKRFGDVPWYSEVLSAEDSSLYKARDSRALVMDSIMADIDYAIENLPEEKKLYLVTKYTALILKARIALYEGSFRKYHQLDIPYKPLLKEAVNASEALMQSGAYHLYNEGGPSSAYRNLFSLTDQNEVETILAANYVKGIKTNSIGYTMTSPTYGAWGMTKDLVNSYLMKDGSRFTDQSGYKTMGYYEEMQNRDPRLTQTTASPDFKMIGENETAPVNLDITTTGYRVIKWLPAADQLATGATYNDIIIFRYAEALLIYAEAKAELGILSQADLDKSINKLRDRVAMPHLKLAAANSHPDPFLAKQYPNVSGSNKGVILEIRRERRIEMFAEGLRWDDLMRWKDGKKIEQPMVGIYFPHLGAFDFDNDGDADVYLYRGSSSGAPSTVTTMINVDQRQLRDPLTGQIGGDKGNLAPFPLGGAFQEPKDYFYPLPIEDLQLNPKLEQNPGWN